MGFLKNFFGGKDNSIQETMANESNQTTKHSPSSKIIFLDQSINSTELVGKASDINEINALLNFSVEFYNNNNFQEAIRCLNTALKQSPTYYEEIALHRNRVVALAAFLGLGKTKPQQNFDFCYAMEHLTRDLEAIIGLYVTNEESITERDDADFLEDCFNMALANYMSTAMAYMAYKENGSSHVYKDQLSRSWKIAFVTDPKNALAVNGTIYPHYQLPK